MPQIGGKNAKKSSKTKSSTSKRHFTVVIGTKEHGLYCSSSPSSAARKAVSKLCTTDKKKKVEFCLREITQGSKKKTYGPYLGHIEKLKKKIELQGRVIENLPVVRLKPKSSAKKGGMRGLKNGSNTDNNSFVEMKEFPIKTPTNENITGEEEEDFPEENDNSLKSPLNIARINLEHAFMHAIIMSIREQRPYMMSNGKTLIENSNRYKTISPERRDKLKEEATNFAEHKPIYVQTTTHHSRKR
jgi:hypothetical protein